ncbi:MAG: hypothetical protein ICV87_06560 [Gemmatimonadetes bacterium]|nr:hypothetical protein [Gemmatimonadota bacterium]
MTGWLAWLEATPAAAAVRESAWLYPALETMHILGLGLLVGAAGCWDLRLLGAARTVPVSDLGRLLLPAARTGFGAAAASGALLFASDAVATAANPAFRAKLLLIALAAANAALFHRAFPSTAAWDRGVRAPARARAAAALSLLLWSLAATAGRLIAYL